MSSTTGMLYIMEFFGTFILSFGVNLSTSYANGVQSPNIFLILASLFCGITLTRKISGGHLNPAVTIGFTTYNKMNNTDWQVGKHRPNEFLYILSQCSGAFTACVLSYIFYSGNILKVGANPNYYSFQALFAEIIGTFIFVYSILCQSNTLYIN